MYTNGNTITRIIVELHLTIYAITGDKSKQRKMFYLIKHCYDIILYKVSERGYDKYEKRR